MSNSAFKLPPTQGLPSGLLQAGQAANDDVVRTASELAQKRWMPAASEVESFVSKFLRVGGRIATKTLFYAQFLELQGDEPVRSVPVVDQPPAGQTVSQWLAEMAEAAEIAARIANKRSELELARKHGQSARVQTLREELDDLYAQVDTIARTYSVHGHRLHAMASAGAAVTSDAANTGIDLDNLDPSIRPQDDFDRFANGGWFDRTTIPDGHPAWSSFGELRLANQRRFQEILEAAMVAHAPKGSAMQKLGDFYVSGMDVERLNAANAEPLAHFLDRIRGTLSTSAIKDALVWLTIHKMGGVLNVSVDVDPQHSDRHILIIDQGGLGLPERDYYFKDDDVSVQLRRQYVDHIAATFRELGDDLDLAQRKARCIMEIETQLAEASLTAVQRRDLKALYENRMTLDALTALAPNTNWNSFFAALNVHDVSEVIVTHPDFVHTMDYMIPTVPEDAWQAYLTWQWVNGASDYLGDRFADHKFEFYGKTLEGMTVQKPREQRVLEQVDTWLGDALGQVFVERYFPESSKQRVNEMVDNLIAAFRARIQTREWMSAETKTAALEKLDRVARNLGFPDQWKDYATVDVSRDSYLGNVLQARAYEFNRMVQKLDQPVDRGEWSMTAPTVNAEYDFGRNRLLFPAGILQPPFFNANADDAVNYGAIGVIIGHELTHGFDDQGALYDANGNMRNWWTDADNDEFQARTARLADQFNKFQVADHLFVNGRLTLGENVADLGGLVMAYDALQRSLTGKPRTLIDGFTPEQRFFMGWAQVWRIQFTPKALEKYVRTNVHSPGHFRIVGPFSNMDAFYQAWNVQPGDAMWRDPQDRIEIW